ncbi:MAG: hypothetical protein K6A44_06660 [bacterium]|nr:hypothetical protein [bacterium]
MLTVDKINSNIIFRSNKLYEHKLSSFGNNAEARKAYKEMNKDVYVDYVDGDISLPTFLAEKLKNFWRIVTKEDPTIEIKARMIEKSLKEGQSDSQIKQNLINNFNMVA